ncbi:Gamma interferon inducible lysosomal thiol reductase GILT [Corchorus olitorius]|uniref:Gamma interferon inducible lysosomal thiol reductase GILT n=1 Tax=Corchorus olitorius TaxID=93759 RepID=A0A1R3JS39_9ROSI|nr:Gamma interferon inducible lysosomal thiol reductase GILT [Corchorus olitorius]
MSHPCQAQNVTLSLYYETLCPYCADFIVNHLVKLFDEGLISIVNLRLVPWGNAVMQPDGSFVCQHGEYECLLNSIDACTITIYPDVDRHFRFILCVERLVLENNINEWVHCFDRTGLGTVPIDCYKSGYGNLLEKQYAAETFQLNPSHQFVPWVLVNGQPLREDFKNFVSYVCKAYQGKQVPQACQSSLPVPLMNHSFKKANLSNPVCYAK